MTYGYIVILDHTKFRVCKKNEERGKISRAGGTAMVWPVISVYFLESSVLLNSLRKSASSHSKLWKICKDTVNFRSYQLAKKSHQ
ncbi:hypothetical protein VIGAN_07184100 [Vigna angularis var. angularis]|uniref:Uncharacterized protein n=1 Tax=Vigna angularis var. angularis TaxID=157739 RepID=A0A0S3SJF1_PHAAN|nr:hypothetical protein VIGAN_07184100 [Vigna angularis var. angularis]